MADTYTTGTISVGALGSPIVGVGTAWSAVAYRGDMLVHNASGVACLVDTVTDDTHIIPFGAHWPGGTISGAAYTLYKNSPLRFANNSAMQVILDTWEMLQNTGVIYAVVGAGVLPDVGIGTNGQYAINLDESPWKFWKKVAGVWVLQGTLVTTASVVGTVTPLIREKLTGNRNYFVDDALGNDANTGLAAGSGAVKTWPKVGALLQALDYAGFSANVFVADGVYTLGLALSGAFIGLGNGTVNFVGNNAQANVTVTIASPGVVAYAAHGLVANKKFQFIPTVTAGVLSVLPTGAVYGVEYFVKTVVDADHFTFSATAGGAAINTSGSQSGTHRISLDANCVISTTNADCINLNNVTGLNFSGIKLQTTTGGNCLAMANRASANFSNWNLGACAGASHIGMRGQSVLNCGGGPRTVTGSCARHLSIYDPGTTMFEDGITITLAPSLTFAAQFLEMATYSYLETVGSRYVGTTVSANGQVSNAHASTGGVGSSKFPGTGVISTPNNGLVT